MSRLIELMTQADIIRENNNYDFACLKNDIAHWKNRAMNAEFKLSQMKDSLLEEGFETEIEGKPYIVTAVPKDDVK